MRPCKVLLKSEARLPTSSLLVIERRSNVGQKQGDIRQEVKDEAGVQNANALEDEANDVTAFANSCHKLLLLELRRLTKELPVAFVNVDLEGR